ncbi:hypothetical protein SFB21_1116 [Acinetobacter bouvetii]|uniref:Uncharacterized protein n=1 Tax=Acinetobacter bouvetii TaxID=202951 RepID=A0A811GA63_9GAMM|nr:hypothetical protein [Acinetobacter bouvetii]CAB1212536.1 hypothetical protein SFB21_1116 [Acinetobacter bouvetii]
MSLLMSMPMKFECHHCKQYYLHLYQPEDHHYPSCPDCHQNGILLGLAEKEDFLQHPLIFLSSYLKQSWHKLSK